MVVPPSSIVDAFNDVTHPLFTSIVNNTRECRILSAIRDALLPKLLSGEIRVAEAERLVEESV